MSKTLYSTENIVSERLMLYNCPVIKLHVLTDNHKT